MKRSIITVFAALMMLAPAFAGGMHGGGGGGMHGGGGGGGCSGLAGIVAELPYETVDLAEEADLLFMREEEKLARDLYQAMDALWGLRIFGNIMWSEQRHMDAILLVLDKYEMADPLGSNPPGTFSDSGLQQLFNQLLAQGSQSLLDALVVGATVEDLDIYDLEGTLGRTDNLDIRTVYQNLQKGSRNHLRSFFDMLLANGVTYEPQYLSVAEFEAIVGSPKEQGLVDADGEPLDCGAGGDGGDGSGFGMGSAHHGGYQHHGFMRSKGLQ